MYFCSFNSAQYSRTQTLNKTRPRTSSFLGPPTTANADRQSFYSKWHIYPSIYPMSSHCYNYPPGQPTTNAPRSYINSNMGTLHATCVRVRINNRFRCSGVNKGAQEAQPPIFQTIHKHTLKLH